MNRICRFFLCVVSGGSAALCFGMYFKSLILGFAVFMVLICFCIATEEQNNK